MKLKVEILEVFFLKSLKNLMRIQNLTVKYLVMLENKCLLILLITNHLQNLVAEMVQNQLNLDKTKNLRKQVF